MIRDFGANEKTARSDVRAGGLDRQNKKTCATDTTNGGGLQRLVIDRWGVLVSAAGRAQ